MKLKRFQQFVNESRYEHHPIETELSDLAAPYFNDFPFEKDIPELIKRFETEWYDLKNEYWWNREITEWRRPHFALDVKVYTSYDMDKVRELMQEPEMSDEEVDDLYWRWLDECRELLVEDLSESGEYPWIDEVGFGGKSGGWLLISPSDNEEEMTEDLREAISDYRSRKDWDADSNEEFQQAIDFTKSDYMDMAELGLSETPELYKDYESAAQNIRDEINKWFKSLERMRAGLAEIEQRVKSFRENDESQFYTWIDEVIVG
jgi:hypothetical protein